MASLHTNLQHLLRNVTDNSERGFIVEMLTGHGQTCSEAMVCALKHLNNHVEGAQNDNQITADSIYTDVHSMLRNVTKATGFQKAIWFVTGCASQEHFEVLLRAFNQFNSYVEGTRPCGQIPSEAALDGEGVCHLNGRLYIKTLVDDLCRGDFFGIILEVDDLVDSGVVESILMKHGLGS